MKNDREPSGSSAPGTEKTGPPKVYFAACGALCDVFWWARRSSVTSDDAKEPPRSSDPSDSTD